MKRVHSDTFDDHLSITSKFRKLKSKLFSVLGRSDEIHIEKASSLNNNELGENRESTPINGSFLNTSQGPITARQLQEYYRSLQLENSMLADSLNNTNDEALKEISTNAESTNIDLTDDQKESKVNKIIVLNDEDKDDEDIKNSKYEIELPESLESLPYFHQPDPLERANLIQLKRMMELEKYRRYRLNYLKEHTRHLGKKADEAEKQNKITKPYKSPKPTDVPSDRRNKSGTFNLSMIEDVPDTVETAAVKPIDSNLVKKLKFVDTESKVANFDISDKPRSFKPEPVKVTNNVFTESTETVAKAPQETHKFDASNISIEDKPSIGFRFGASNLKDTTPLKPSLETVIDVDALNKQSTENKKAFSFTPSAPSTALSSSTEKASNATSLFGQNKASANLFSSKDDTPSADGVGISMFGATNKEKNDVNKPLFNFGKPAAKDSFPQVNLQNSITTEKKKEIEKPSFQLQIPQNDSKRSLDELSEEKPKKFNFGPLVKPDEISVTGPPKFGLLNKTNDSTSSESASTGAFSFNANKTAELPKFSFGKASNTDNATLESKTGLKPEEKNKPKFSFDTFKASDKPADAISFGKTVAGSNDISQKPIFNFNSKTTATADNDETKASKSSSFKFGNNVTVPLQTSKVVNTTESDTASQDTGSKFNSASNNDNKDTGGNVESIKVTKPVFSFGGTKQTQLPGFGSAASSVTTPGASLSPVPVQNAAPTGTFSFATTTKPNIPQMSFNTDTTTSKQDVPKFNFNMNNKTSSDDKTTSEVKANETTTVGNMFSFNSNAFPSLEEAKQKALLINQNQSSPALKFGDHANTPNVTSSNGLGGGFSNANNKFNNSTNNNANFSFKSNSPASGFGGSNNQAVGFSNNMNGNTGFGNSGPAFGGTNTSFGGTNTAFGATNTGFGGTNTGFGGTNTGFGGTNTGFGGTNTGFGGTNTGFGGTNTGFGGTNVGMNANIMNNMNANSNVGLNTNTGLNVNVNNSGFSFGGSGPSSGVNSRASTPNFNFMGSQGQNVDPSAIFGANGNNDVQNTGPSRRRIAYPRRRR